MSNAPVLDPQFAPFLAAMAQIPPLSQRTLAEIRTAWDLSVFGEPEAVAKVRDLTIPVAHGTIAARLYLPFGRASAEEGDFTSVAYDVSIDGSGQSADRCRSDSRRRSSSIASWPTRRMEPSAMA